MDRNDFENKAYSGYVSRGIGDTDGWYTPISKDYFVNALRLRVPVSPEDFARSNDTEFRPTEQECSDYNASFIGKPKSLRLAIRNEHGWKSIEVSGTVDAHETLGRIAVAQGFIEARLEDYAMLEGHWVPQIRQIDGSFVKGNKAVTDMKYIRRGDITRAYAKLLDYSETDDLSC